MNQGARELLAAVVLGAALLGLVVLLSVRDYRQGFILESNRSYMPAVRVLEQEVALPQAEPEPDAPEPEPDAPGGMP